MPQREKPLKARTKDDDESTGNPTEKHDTHREDDEALPGDGRDRKGGLSKESGDATSKGQS